MFIWYITIKGRSYNYSSPYYINYHSFYHYKIIAII